MAVALETVVKQLEDSGIVAQGKLENFIPPKAAPKDAHELVAQLVKEHHLTKFQAAQVAAGKSKSLILGEYTILDRIGAGGMGQVLKALHRRMDRTVAIKMLPSATMKDAAAIARFEREVRAAAKLSHPNIVAAHDAGQANGVHFLVMEYVEGQDLSALVKKNGAFPVAKATNYILQAARGLEFAHGEGVVHRDIKPANLLLDKKGVVKILDMGLARIESDGETATQAELTGTGAVMGTVDYMAPEQAMSTKSADARADIYSLGCSLFYLLTGKPTFEGETITAKLVAHQAHPIPELRKACSEASAELESVFSKMLAKKLEDRYQSMSEVIADLERLGGRSQTSLGTSQAASTNCENSALTFLKDMPIQQTLHKSKATKKIAAAKSNDGKQPPWKNTKVLIGAAFLGVLVLAGIIVSLQTKDGTLIVEVDQPDAMVQVLDSEGKVEVSQKGVAGKVTISVDPGKHRLRVEKNGFVVFGQEFEMESGGKKAITAKLVSVKMQSTTNEVALDFDGKSSFVYTPLVYKNDGPLTVEAFVVARNRKVGTVISNASDTGFSLEIVKSKWAASSLTKSQTTTQVSLAEVEGEKSHLAAVFDGTSIRLFKDGVLQGASVADQEFVSRPYQIVIGADPTGKKGPQLPVSPSAVFDGIIDEVRISKVARYTGDFKPDPRFTPDADTIALYHFDEGSGDTAFDSSDNKHHAKIVGAKWVKADSSNLGAVATASTSKSPAVSFLTATSPVPPLAKAPFDAAQAKQHQQAWAKHLGTEVETTNSVGMKMVLIPPGEFMMGSTDEQVAAALKAAEETKADQGTKDRIEKAERPQHQVVITKPFLMGATEVTVGQFKNFSASGYVTAAEQEELKAKASPPPVVPGQPAKPIQTYLKPGYVVADDSPAAVITWNDAVAYCNWLSVQEKLDPCYVLNGNTSQLQPNKNGYRLPTEAEWEYACRAGTTTQYSFGDDHQQLEQYGWYNKNHGGRTHAVGTKLPNPFGLSDMHGNVWEWCQDYYDEKWHEKTLANDPNGPFSGSDRVLRGGHWNYYASYCRSAYRGNNSPSHRNNVSGFRVVRVW
ncbi:Serine/threonine-protein kinase PknB [Anatilimnocola aggregata]|uniref:Serine/threonine-protein kinase PknB n=1 Tax=Anatilimnocola aggregata TaxID=2528021 RepID=A0A517YMF6_9BACT|nr:SUMF1/EgtB/PvdO family nonheme iron enzyme [Anatilimnocola aggregata]QDU31402.1 Serine/threonine-protein kinase PknB [Anatilimnocola aggregata]